jgi:hypothetical protein
VTFDNLAWRYDDLFSCSRIGTQRGAVWEVLADTFLPGDAILVLNCRTREDAIFLAMLDVSVVACDAADGMIHAGRNHGALFDGALANFSGLNAIAGLNQTARDLPTLVTMGAPIIVCLSSRFCFSETLWFLLHGKFRKAFRRSSGIAPLPGLEGSEEVVFTIFCHAVLHGDRYSGSAIVSGTGVPQTSPSPRPTVPNRQGHFPPALIPDDRGSHAPLL